MSKSIASNHLGRFSLNQCRKINVRDIMNQAKTSYMKEIIQNMCGFPLDVYETPCHFGGKRYWFSCPFCAKRVFTLYQDPVVGTMMCRHCTGIGYSKQRYKGMIEEKDPYSVDSSTLTV